VAPAEGETLGDTLADGDRLRDGERDTLADGDRLRDGERDTLADGEIDAEPDGLALALGEIEDEADGDSDGEPARTLTPPSASALGFRT